MLVFASDRDERLALTIHPSVNASVLQLRRQLNRAVTGTGPSGTLQ